MGVHELAEWARVLVPTAAVVVASVTGAALNTPAGLLPLLVPRRWRWWYRKWVSGRWLFARGRGKQRSARISKRLRAMVLRADRRRCVFCFSPVALQVDHIVPWSLGGLTCLWNCAVLCAAHNRVKSNYWRSDAGRVYYRPWEGKADAKTAAAILSVEQDRRHSVARWLRAFGLLPG